MACRKAKLTAWVSADIVKPRRSRARPLLGVSYQALDRQGACWMSGSCKEFFDASAEDIAREDRDADRPEAR
jgi:hypothetical protein